MKKIIILSLCILLMLSFCIVSSAEEKEISRNAEYTLVTPASEAYNDDGKKLTDGVYGTHPEGHEGYYSSGAYVGFNKDNLNANGKFAVIVDLGKKYGNISGITVGYLNEINAGISAPMSISVALSDERNGSYTEIGIIDTIVENVDIRQTFAKTLKTVNATGRYVLVTITPMSYTDKDGIISIAPWTFIDEISVHATAEPLEENSQPEENSQSTDDEVSADISDVSEESKSPEVSDISNESTVSDISEVSENSEVSDTEPDKTPQMGDSLEIFAFVLLALASLGMMIALFTTKKKNEF